MMKFLVNYLNLYKINLLGPDEFIKEQFQKCLSEIKSKELKFDFEEI